MALLQISEPGQSPLPHQRKRAVGIDLGTTNSLVASVRSGSAETLPDLQGRHLLPSVVYYGEAGVLVGEEARQHALGEPHDTIASVKRLMGRGIGDVAELGSSLPYAFEPSEGGMPLIRTRRGLVSPIQVSAEILRALRERAEETLGGALDGAVITVPAYFDDAQRQATREAASQAGLNLLRLLNEPTAAAVAYGLDQGGEGTIAVYDLGGGTFDISILRLSRGVFEVLATGGDSGLGGDDFDHALAQWALDRAGHTAALAAGELRALLAWARDAKEALSASAQVAVELPFLRLSTVLLRGEFEALVEPLVARTVRAARRALRDAGLKPQQVDSVVLVGGSTRVPCVRAAVAELFGREPLASIDPDRVVAIGAALQADVLAGNKPGEEMLLLDVIPLSLGIETMGGLVEKIIPRNTTIPVARAQEFTTYKDGQTAMAIQVVQGERELVADCRSLGQFVLRGIPPMVAGAAKVRVTFQVDADGLLNVTAQEVNSGVEAGIQIKPAFGLTEGDIASMLKASYEFAREDRDARALREEQVEAERMLEALAAAMQQDATLLEAGERAQLESAMAGLRGLVASGTAEAIRTAVEQLGALSEPFAARRMDRSVARALAGHTLDEFEGEE